MLFEAKADESFTAGWKLATALFKPHMTRHVYSTSSLTDCLQILMMAFLVSRAATNSHVDSQSQQSKYQCVIYVNEI